MGEKKKLREELALVQSNVEQLNYENQQLRQQLVDNQSAPPFRMITDAKPTPVRIQIATKLGIDPASFQAGITDETILEAVERLRNPHHGMDHGDALVVGKNDSLAEAIHHNRAERVTLENAVSTSRGTLNRVAAALGVSEWGPDGEEIVDKAQRFGVFWHWLRKRLYAAEAAITEDDKRAAAALTAGLPPAPVAVADEIRHILAALVGDKRLSEILKNKPAKVSKTVLDLAENQAPSGNLYLDREFTTDDIEFIRDALRRISGSGAATRINQLHLVFERLALSPAARAEFLSWINVVVLPVLRKQHAAYTEVPKEN